MYSTYDFITRKVGTTNKPTLNNKEVLAGITVYNHDNIFYWQGDNKTVLTEIHWKYRIYKGKY